MMSDYEGYRAWTNYSNSGTLPFNSGLSVIKDRPIIIGHTINYETNKFLENTYDTYVARKDQYQLDKGIIDAYLDAKAEGDYLEMRGAKLAVAMEMLKSIFLDAQKLVEIDKKSLGDYIIDKEFFKMHKKKIEDFLKSYLEENNIKSEDRGRLYRNISCLNRTSFEDALRGLWKDIDLDLDDNIICLFINSRNSLVHQGKFCCKTNDTNIKCPPLNDPVEEYFFLVDILDKTILRILGYKGLYYSCYKKDLVLL